VSKSGLATGKKDRCKLKSTKLKKVTSIITMRITETHLDGNFSLL
jgi:hypothetical protein